MADVQITPTAIATEYKIWAGATVFFTTDLIGYKFFVNSLTDVVYQKTTDGGANWGAQVTVVSGTVSCAAAWWDRQTPGDAGTLIHIACCETGGDDTIYRSLDTSTDTLGTQRVALAGVSYAALASGTYDTRCISITKLQNGDLIIVGNPDTGVEFHVRRSTDGGVNWGNLALPSMGLAYFQILPAHTGTSGDFLLIARAFTAGASPVFHVYNSGANTWAQTTGIATGTASTTYSMMAASLRRSDNKIFLVYQNDLDSATTDTVVYEIHAASTASGGVTCTARTNVTTDTSELVQCGLCIDENTGDLYVLYLIGGTWATSTSVAMKKSTDSGATWSSQSVLSTTNRDYRSVSCPPIIVGNGRVYPTSFDSASSDIFGNKDNSIVITGGVSGAAQLFLNDVTLVAAGSAPSSGAAAITLGAVTLAAAGSAPSVGSAAITLGAVTLAAHGITPPLGTVALAHAENWRATPDCMAFVNDLVGYLFYIDPSLALVYIKTTDAGATWGTPVVVRAGTVDCFAIHYALDGYIYIAYQDSATHDILFRYLNPATDAFTPTVAASATGTVVYNGASFTGIGGDITERGIDIARNANGNLYIISNPDSGTERGFYRSTDFGSTWTPRATPDTTGRVFRLQPALSFTMDAADIALIAWPVPGATKLTCYVYDDSANTWGATVLSSLPDGAGNTNYRQMATHLFQDPGSPTVEAGEESIILVYWTLFNNASARLVAAEIVPGLGTNGSTYRALADVTSEANAAQCCVFGDQILDDIYVGYLAGGTFGTSAHVVYRRSRDRGATWEAAIQVDTSLADVRAVWCPRMPAGELESRFLLIWQDEDTGALVVNAASSLGMYGSLDDRIEITYKPGISFWIIPLIHAAHSEYYFIGVNTSGATLDVPLYIRVGRGSTLVATLTLATGVFEGNELTFAPILASEFWISCQVG